MRNLKKNCLQSLKHQNKLFAQLQNKKNKLFAITFMFANLYFVFDVYVDIR